MTAPTSQPDFPSEPQSQSNHQRRNGRFRIPVADHPQWRAYLAKRRILEAVIAANAWVEREEWAGQDVLVWRTTRRDGSPGATRRRLLKKLTTKDKRQAKLRWQFAGQKTDEPFYYVGTLEDLKREIARAGGKVYIVEGEFDVWSLHRLGIRNVIGIYGISNIPQDIASLFDEIGVTEFVYFADNDKAGEKGGSNLRTLLHKSGWRGEGDYRKFAGPDIPDKGDANDLLCHHFPDMSQARAALDALPKFSPGIKQKPIKTPSTEIDHDQQGWGAVKDEHYDISKATPLIHQLRNRGDDECRASPSSQQSWRKYSGKYHGRKRGRPRRFNQSLENHSAH